MGKTNMPGAIPKEWEALTDSQITRIMAEAYGCSVTQRIKIVQQPRGGYINPKAFITEKIDDGNKELNDSESVNASLVGTTVDYLTRFMLGTPVTKVFLISFEGAGEVDEEENAAILMAGINGLDDESIINAVKLSGYDVCYRNGKKYYKPVDEIVPDKATIENIKIMVNRALAFFDKYGPKVLDSFTFEGGYTDAVRTGDGDFTTEDTIWEFKTSKLPIKKEHTLQLLMYWRMGLRSIHPEFKSIKYLGVFNPRQNTISRIAVKDIPEKTIKEVEKEVIGYKD